MDGNHCSPLVLIHGAQIVDADTGGPYNPDTFELTTEEGFKYALKEGVGILNVTDPYGNTVFYGPNGLQQTAQLYVTFERDSQGRITKAPDPNGKSLSYAYNSEGELATVTDREGKVTKFSYATEYDPAGRVTATTDTRGKRSTMEYPRWPLQTPPLMASQTPPGRTHGL